MGAGPVAGRQQVHLPGSTWSPSNQPAAGNPKSSFALAQVYFSPYSCWPWTVLRLGAAMPLHDPHLPAASRLAIVVL